MKQEYKTDDVVNCNSLEVPSKEETLDCEKLKFLIGKYINGHKIVNVTKDCFIKGQVDIFTDYVEIDSFGNRIIERFAITEDKSRRENDGR